ncbi:MAG: hypothetical protein V9E90_07140 [Saprospiraceae bacterium]|jgi:hypothetical protein
MKILLFFPPWTRKLGWYLLIPSFLAGLYCIFTDFEVDFLKLPMFAIYQDQFMGQTSYFSLVEDNLTMELIGICYVLGLLFTGFSKLQIEDEFTIQMRYNALMWSTLMSCFLLGFTLLFFYGTGFFICMIFNMISIPTIYVLRFSYLIHRSNSSAE